MTEVRQRIASDPRFDGVEPFVPAIPLSSPTMHGDEQHWVAEAFRSNWVTDIVRRCFL